MSEQSTAQTGLTAADIFEGDDLEALEVVIPEWRKNGEPGKLWIRQMPCDVGLVFQDAMKIESNKEEGMYLIVIATAVDAKIEGKPLFNAQDIERLRKKNLKVLDRLQKLALAHNFGTAEAVEKLKNDYAVAAHGASPLSLPAN